MYLFFYDFDKVFLNSICLIVIFILDLVVCVYILFGSMGIGIFLVFVRIVNLFFFISVLRGV